ncbi:MAG: hypothetical protein R3E03_05460 [Novosphingobium sp.]
MKNIVTGLALTAFVAYVSSIVSKQYGAIQYTLLGSLVSLVGTLGRGATGEAFGQFGYAVVFRWTALTAVVSTVFVLLEWGRNAPGRTSRPDPGGAAVRWRGATCFVPDPECSAEKVDTFAVLGVTFGLEGDLPVPNRSKHARLRRPGPYRRSPLCRKIGGVRRRGRGIRGSAAALPRQVQRTGDQHVTHAGAALSAQPR